MRLLVLVGTVLIAGCLRSQPPPSEATSDRGRQCFCGGWLLLLPPVEKVTGDDMHDPQAVNFRGWRGQRDVPLQTWRQQSAHDTAKECQAAQKALRWDSSRRLVSLIDNLPAGTVGEQLLDASAQEAAQLRDSRCVSTDMLSSKK